MNFNKILILGIILLFAGSAAASAHEVKVKVGPAAGGVSAGKTFNVEIIVSGENISGVDFNLLFDKNLLTAEEVNEGAFLKNFGETSLSPGNGITDGSVSFASVLTSLGVASGTGTVAVITFKAKFGGTSALTLQGTSPYPNILADANLESIPAVNITGASVKISGPEYKNQTVSTTNTTKPAAGSNQTLGTPGNNTSALTVPASGNVTPPAGNQTPPTNESAEKNITSPAGNQTIKENKTGGQEEKAKKLIIESPANAETGQAIKIKVRDQDNNPVRDVIVSVTLPDNTRIQEKTDVNGEIKNIEVNQKGTIALDAKKEGYSPASGMITVTLKPGGFNYLWLLAAGIIIILVILWLRSRD